MNSRAAASQTKPLVTAVAPWYGSQAGINRMVVPELARARQLYDVCCGGLSLLLALKPGHYQETTHHKGKTVSRWVRRREVVNDLHGGLVNVCRVLASHRRGALAKQLDETVCHEAIFHEAAAWLDGHHGVVAPSVFEAGVEHHMAAYYQCIVWWMGAGGEAGTGGTPRMSKRHSAGGGAGASRFRAFVGSIEGIGKRLERVEIWQQDAVGLIDKIKDEDGTAIYVDPPFLVGGQRYEHTVDEAWWERLAEALGRFERCKLVVRHYPHERMEAWFPPGFWRWETSERNKASTQPGRGLGGGATRATEMLMCKGVLP